MKPYKASGNSGPGALATMIGVGLAGTFGTAIIGGFITRWLDLIILFAAVMGVVAGFAVKSGARRGHCRNYAMIAGVAVVMGLLVYGGKLFANYRNERRTFIATLEEKITADKTSFQAASNPQLSPAKLAETFVDDYYIKKTGSSGFVGWFKLMLDNGISISHHGSGGLNLGWWGSLILILIEAGFAAFASTATAVSLLEEPYCERCLVWAEDAWNRTTTVETLGTLVERLQPDLEPPAGILSDLPPTDPAAPHGKVVLSWCPKCHEGYLKASLVTVAGKEKKEEVVIDNLHVTPLELQTLTTAVPGAAPTASPPEAGA